MGLTLALHTRILRFGELRGWFAERKSRSTHQTPAKTFGRQSFDPHRDTHRQFP
jgi:hypothetical protein